MKKEKTHKIHYISSISVSNKKSNKYDLRKDLFNEKINQDILDNKKIFGQKNLKKVERIKNSYTNVNDKISNILNESKEDHYKSKISMKKHNYHSIFYSRDNLTRLSKVSNSVDKIKSNNINKKIYTPRRHISTNISIPFKKEATIIHQRYMTLSNIHKRRNNSIMKILDKKKK